MVDVWDILFVIAQIFFYILGIVIIVQLVKVILGGSWETLDILVTLVVLNITISFGVMTHLIKLNRLIYGHIQWHKGKGN